MTACGCRVEQGFEKSAEAGTSQVFTGRGATITVTTTSTELSGAAPAPRIVYCPLHERADRLAAALADLFKAALQRLTLLNDDPEIAAARALLREIGQ